MWKTSVAGGIVLIFFSHFLPQAQSCADKFLVIGRRLRIERAYPAKHPSSVVLYAANQKKMKDLEATLKKAGHKITVVTNEQQLVSTLNSARFDIVVVSFDNIAGLTNKIIATTSKPIVLPIIDQPKGVKIASNATQEPCVLKYQDKNKDAIKRVDQLMKLKIERKPIKCDWSK